jgi:hypothetical protein
MGKDETCMYYGCDQVRRRTKHLLSHLQRDLFQVSGVTHSQNERTKKKKRPND